VLAGGGGGASGENAALFTLLNELAKTGINNLTRTYNQTDKIHILHTLQMYKGMLDNPELVRRLARTDDSGGGGGGAAVASIDDENNDADNNDLPRQFPLKIRNPSQSPPLRPMNPGPTGTGANVPIDSLVDTNVDLIFVKITDLYSQEDYTIIYHTLLKIQNDAQYYMNYVEGLNKILEPVNIRIKKWIDDNIVF
jgi:hypothetical protein